MPDETFKSKDLTVLIRISDLVQSPLQSRFEKMAAPAYTTKNYKRKEKEKVQKNELDELTASIKDTGLIQPILVRPLGEGYEIIDGHRRVEAMKKLGRGQIMAIIKDDSERDAQIMHVIGNLQRKNLKPIEQALTCQKMLDTGIFKDKRELSKAIAKDETFVGDLLATLQMDSRIIVDLAKNNLVKDLRILRLIRLSAPVDKNGVSEAQWELYRKVLFSKMGRKELSVLLKKSDKSAALKTWHMKSNAKKVTISLETGKMDQATRDRFLKLIAEKMKEISDTL
jgi:ParB/RepB/Spo0J family partition protein